MVRRGASKERMMKIGSKVSVLKLEIFHHVSLAGVIEEIDEMDGECLVRLAKGGSMWVPFDLVIERGAS
jgi:hypothetical protein